jgi:hypothetical protein
LPGPPTTPDKITIVQDVNVNGTTFANSNVEVTTKITNTGASSVNLGIRYLWDFQIGGDDGPTFQEGSSGPVHTIEANFPPPTFDFYTITNNDPSTPIYKVLGSFAGPSNVTPLPTTPTQLTYGCWPVGFVTAFDYTTAGRDVSTATSTSCFGSGSDSLVFYWWGRSATQGAITLAPTASVTERALLFATPPTVPPPFNQTQVTTSLHGGSQSGPIITVTAGTAVTDSATLINATPTAGGTVTYTVYSDPTCTTVFAAAGTKTVTNGIVPDSNAVTFNTAGTFYWQAVYSGDSQNSSSKSVCGSEQVVVRAGPPATLLLTPPFKTNTVGDQHCVTATVRDLFGNPTPGITVRFTVIGAAATFSTPPSGSSTTNAAGQAGFCFTAALPGANGIHAFADTNNSGNQDAGEPFGDATKTWILPVGTALCEVKITQGGWITTIMGDRASFGGVARSDAAGAASGNEEYQDHGPAQAMNLKATSIDAITCTADRKTADIYGTATIDGSGAFAFRIRVTDNGEPGVGQDVYGIIVSNGYVSGDKVLQGGNVQIH